ncbi:protein disulfide isomerase [Rhizoctonia solani]|uniref:Protein disulfide isomerase n=1 Tax=Rhizoctonia solani TaxID=456999 RepID=A0A8H8SU65_9AGAM|nr:protein disulfide isomerase [Rhizoctonia solani]QRW17037.1 protein disulfide isomerase [Rhizoctonia solani]
MPRPTLGSQTYKATIRSSQVFLEYTTIPRRQLHCLDTHHEVILTSPTWARSCCLGRMYPKNGAVKQLSAAEWKQAMNEEITAITAFVAPWCGQSSRVTIGYYPILCVDCDAQENKQLCGEQGVKGFPTIKGFPRGKKGVPHDYQGERTSGALVDFATSEVPSRVKTLRGTPAIQSWVKSTDSSLPHILLLTQKPKLPVLWKVLGWRHHKDISFGATKDEKGDIIKELGIDAPADGKSKVLIWAPGPLLLLSTMFDPLQKFLKTLPGKGHSEL